MVVPGFGSLLNACDPARRAKLRCAGALRHPRRRSPCRTASRCSRGSRSGAGSPPGSIYLAGAQPGWDQRPDWFAAARRLRARGAALLAAPARRAHAADAGARAWAGAATGPTREVVVSSEYGPATWRALAWCRRTGRPLGGHERADAVERPDAVRAATARAPAGWRRGWTASSCSARRGWSGSSGMGVGPRRGSR